MNSELRIGDFLYRSKSIVEHVGIFLGERGVIHNSPDGNVQLSTLSHFSAGKEIKVVHKKIDSLHLFEERVTNILSGDQRYNALNFNCEQVANWLMTGKKYSPQIKGAVIGTGLGALLCTTSETKHPLVMCAMGGILGLLAVNVYRNYDKGLLI